MKELKANHKGISIQKGFFTFNGLCQLKEGNVLINTLKLIDPVIYKINLNACKGNNTNNEGSLFSLSSVMITAMLLQWQVL